MSNQLTPKKYRAFISYSSKDKRWGKWLHKRLEGYTIPKSFQKNKLLDGSILGKNIRPIFRDRDELSSSAELGSSIRRALRQSCYLIVLCSKNSAQSQWVNKEIEDFKALDGSNRILALILNGEPNATSNPNISNNEECFPPALRYPIDPLAGDLRKEGDGKERGLLKVIAGVSQLDFDTLYRRHEKIQRNKRLILGSLIGIIVLLLTSLSIFSFQQTQIANKKTKEVEKQRDDLETAQSKIQVEQERKEKLLWQASRSNHQNATRNFSLKSVEKHSEALAHLQSAITIQPNNNNAALKAISSLVFSDSYLPQQQRIWRIGQKYGYTTISPNAKYSAVYDGNNVLLLDLSTGKKLWEYQSNQSELPRFHFSPNESKLVIQSGKFLHLLDSSTGKIIFEKIYNSIECVCVSPNGLYIAIGHSEKEICVIDTLKGTKKWNHSLSNQCSNLVFSPNNSHLAAATNENGIIYCFNLFSGEKLWHKKFDIYDFNIFTFSPSGNNLVIVTGSDGTLRFISSSSGKQIFNYEDSNNESVLDIVFSPDSTRYIISSHHLDSYISNTPGTIKIFDSLSNKELWSFESDSCTSCITFSPDGLYILAAYEDSSFHKFNASYGPSNTEKIQFSSVIRDIQFNFLGSEYTLSNNNTIRTFLFLNNKEYPWSDYRSLNYIVSPNGKFVVTQPYQNLNVFNTTSEEKVWEMKLDQISERVSFAVNDSNIIVNVHGQRLVLIDLKTGKTIQNLLLSSQRKPILSPNGSYIAIHLNEDTVVIYDSLLSRKIWSSKRREGYDHVSFSPDSSMLLLEESHGSDPAHSLRRIIDLKTGKEIWNKPTKSYKSFTFSPDSSYISTIRSDEMLIILDSKTGTELWKVKSNKYLFSKDITFSPDSSYIAINKQNNLSVLFCKTGKEIFNFQSSEKINRYSLGTQNVAIVTNDSNLQVFDIDTGNSLWGQKFTETSCYEITIHPNERFIVAHIMHLEKNDYLQFFDLLSGADIKNYTLKSPPEADTNEHSISNIHFSDDGEFISAQGGYTYLPLKALFNISHLHFECTQHTPLIKKFLAYNSSMVIDEHGHLQHLPQDELINLHSYIQKVVKSDKNDPIYNLFRWRYTPLIKKTLSPNSKVFLRNDISFKLRSAENDSRIKSAYTRAPWHPLAPVALARMKRNTNNQTRKKFLCQLTYQRLKEADVNIWGKDHLSKDIHHAAQWMKDLGYPDLAKKTAQLSPKKSSGKITQ